MELLPDPVEIRAIGALVEKQVTTPEYYPLTLNALVAACNQKSNREPVMEVSEADVQRAYALGANSYLVKPVSFEELSQLMHALNVYWDGWNVKPEIGAA